MRRIHPALALAFVIATPAFAQTPHPYPERLSSEGEVRDVQEWWIAVARANAYRENGTGLAVAAKRKDDAEIRAAQDAVKQALMNSGSSTTDAGMAGAKAAGTSPALMGGGGRALGGCASDENEAGLAYHSGGFCLPGGR